MVMIIKTFLGFYLITLALSSAFLIVHALTVMNDLVLATHTTLLNVVLLLLAVILTA